MTLAKHPGRCWLAIAAVTTALAGCASVFACGLPVAFEGMHEVARTSAAGVTVVQYSEKASVTAYQTDFDTRKVAVAFGRDPRAVNEVAGISPLNRGKESRKTLLVAPPYADQIVRRHYSRKKRHHRNWTIWREEIQYGTQGYSAGYTIDCATAYRLRDHDVIAVSECFSLENWPRFIRTLDAMTEVIDGAVIPSASQ